MSGVTKSAPTLMDIYVPIYDFNITVVLDAKHWENGDVKKLFKKRNPKTYTDKGYYEFYEDAKDMTRALGVFIYSDTLINQYVIYIPKWRDSSLCMSTFTHELFHLVHRALQFKGLSLTNSSEEAYAYLTSYVTQEFFNQLWK